MKTMVSNTTCAYLNINRRSEKRPSYVYDALTMVRLVEYDDEKDEWTVELTLPNGELEFMEVRPGAISIDLHNVSQRMDNVEGQVYKPGVRVPIGLLSKAR